MEIIGFIGGLLFTVGISMIMLIVIVIVAGPAFLFLFSGKVEFNNSTLIKHNSNNPYDYDEDN